MDVNDVLPCVEPIYRFCCRRLNSRYDAEDLAGEILCAVLEGAAKYEITSLDAWVWRVARNRYARLIQRRKREADVMVDWKRQREDDEALENGFMSDWLPGNGMPGNEFSGNGFSEDRCPGERRPEALDALFRVLHTLATEYRILLVDHYLGEMSVKALAEKYRLTETTVKWRLHVGRKKMRERIEASMKQNTGTEHNTAIYRKINWNTTTCNGNFSPNRYLHSQIARAICRAAYEKPLTVEEISLATGIPALYVEDELTGLLYGDALTKTEGERGPAKYATDFILFSKENQRAVSGVTDEMVQTAADAFTAMFREKEDAVRALSFYGHDFGMARLGHILVPFCLREKLRQIKDDRLHLENGPYPERQDGGFGWYVVDEIDEDRQSWGAGCNIAGDDSGSGKGGSIVYYWLEPYFDLNVYHNGGTRWLMTKGIPHAAVNGEIPAGLLTDEDAARLLRVNLIEKSAEGLRLRFAAFHGDEFASFTALFPLVIPGFDDALAKWILDVRESFLSFVPKRLHGQVNQRVSGYVQDLCGLTTAELIFRGVLTGPLEEKPLTDGVFFQSLR